MNSNEVISNRAIEIAGGEMGTSSRTPSDDVNRGQSSNDTFPSYTCSRRSHSRPAAASIRELRNTFNVLEKQYADVVKIGRTHLQDATPITLGQEISSWRAQLDDRLAGIERLCLAFMNWLSAAPPSAQASTPIHSLVIPRLPL